MKKFSFIFSVMFCLAGFIAGAQTSSIVKDIKLGEKQSSWPLYLTNSNGWLYFTADDGINGYQVWKSDGTEQGTQIVKLISGTPRNLIDLDGTLFFTVTSSAGTQRLWKTDGTESGTVMVREFYPAMASVGVGMFVPLNNKLLFVVWYNESITELWQTDGTEFGTELLKRFDNKDALHIRTVENLTAVGSAAYFVTNDYFNYQLWRTDGTADGTVPLDNKYTYTGPQLITPTPDNQFLFMCGCDTISTCLMKSDGTNEGTTRVLKMMPYANGTFVREIGPAFEGGNYLVVSTNTGSGDAELWKTDGTEAGTVRVKDIIPGPKGSYPKKLKMINGTLYFTASSEDIYEELWKSDGTEDGTKMVKDIYFNYESTPSNFTNVHGMLYFMTVHPAYNTAEIWRTDGTEYGTERIDSNGYISGNLIYSSGNLFFTSIALQTTGGELWSFPVDQYFSDVKDDTHVDNSLKIFPNPAKESMTLTVNAENFKSAKCIIYNSLGQQMLRFSVDSPQQTFSVNALPNGIYTLQLQSENTIIRQRVSIIR